MVLQRVLFLVLVAAGAFVLWFAWSETERSLPRENPTVAPVAPTLLTERSDPAPTPLPPGRAAERVVELDPIERNLTVGEHAQRTGAPREEVRVRVLVHGPEGPLIGASVRAQSWVEATDETTLHETRTNERGLAELTFDAFVHVDWIYAVPADPSLGAVFGEYHVNLEGGSIFEAWFRTEPAARVAGRVEFEDGTPAVGVEVHAYLSYFLGDPQATWRPGPFRARTDAEGRFLFAALPAREWSIGVPPFAYLQLAPSLPSVDRFTPQAGETTELPTIRITPLHEVTVNVLSAGAEPLPALEATLEPIDFSSSTVRRRTKEELRERPVHRWLRGEEPFRDPNAPSEDETPWVYEPLVKPIDANGSVSFTVVAGTWDLKLRPTFAPPGEGDVWHRSQLFVPCRAVTVRVDGGSGRIAGRLVAPDGSPLGQERVTLESSANGWTREWARETGSDGTFLFDQLPLDGAFSLQANVLPFLPERWSVTPGDELRTYRTREPARLLVEVVDPEGRPVHRPTLHLLGGTPRSGTHTLRPADANYLESMVAEKLRCRGDESGRVEITRLLPGTYEIGVLKRFATGALDARGYLETERRPWVSWRLDTAVEDVQRVVLDLKGYEPPPRTPVAVHHGTVYDGRTGTPMQAQVQLSRDGEVVLRNWSDALDGKFRLVVPRGELELVVLRRGYRPHREIVREPEAEEHLHRVALEPDASELVLRVVHPDGSALDDFDIELLDRTRRTVPAFYGDGNVWLERYTAERNATVHVAGLVPGAYVVKLELFGYPLGEFDLEFTGSGAQELVTLPLEETPEELRTRIAKLLAGE